MKTINERDFLKNGHWGCKMPHTGPVRMSVMRHRPYSAALKGRWLRGKNGVILTYKTEAGAIAAIHEAAKVQ